ncbi:uncharacterized protein H6S33_011247 [Morchella sextelata]|uniref:uncharacterized protein n=1 Tax=Morchella sextelata TaxID=1174677 RepID=UPI001D04D275|nr:uncharacterized protein H6S33_011247 [Morchella sextelata]KAH0610820.1 hypothetical protein H6S33_011247 [Morchella sextelata]
MTNTGVDGVRDGPAQPNMKNDSITAMHPNSPLSTDSFRDITAEFFEASAKLNVGQLVKDPYFTLLQAVGALEIMDPKMDSGMLEAEYESFNALKPRLPEEVIGIMDQLLSYEMAWHNGSALSQTVFTCLYIDRLLSSGPETLAQATFASFTGIEGDTDSKERQLLENVLRPYCLALIKCCYCVNQQIQMEHIYEEEDFVTQTYNVSLLDSVEPNEILNILDSALQWLEATKNSYTNEIFEALECRLLHRKSFFRDLSREIEEWVSGVPSEWDSSLELLAKVEKSHPLGKPVSEAFSTSVQRKLASQVPPRPMVEISFKDATSSLKKLCIEGKDVLKILKYQGSTNLVNYFLNFMARKPSPSPYVRSLLQSLFFKEMKILGTMPIKQLLFDDVRELTNPVDLLLDPRNEAVEAPQDPRFNIVKRTNWFIERAGRSYLDLFRNICQNRSRLRRNLCHAILDWDSLQVECEEIDSELRELTQEEPQKTPNGPPSYSFPLSSWVYLYKLRQMEWIILLGFELEVYQPHEYADMFWYLQIYVRTKIGHLERIRQFAALNTKVVSKNKKKKGYSANAQQQKSLSLLNYYLLEGSAIQELAGAMVNVYVALSRLTLLRKPPQPYSSDHLRYELRMKPFFTIGCPEVVPYDIFATLVDNPQVETLELLELASESIAQARKDFDQLGKLDEETSRTVLCEDAFKINNREMLRSCIGLSVAVAQITKALKSAGGATQEYLEVEIERAKYHPSFPVPSIKNKAPIKTAPIKTEPIETDPSKTEPSKTDPSKTEPSKTEPSKTEPSKTEPSKTEPRKKTPKKKATGKKK